MRHGLASRPAGEPSWLDALGDARLRPAIEAVPADPARSCSIESLASIARLSRTAFAQRFHRTSGDTPMGYVARMRIHRAMTRLATSAATLDAVAADVGYADAFALSKALKRLTGRSPGDGRRDAQHAAAESVGTSWPAGIASA